MKRTLNRRVHEKRGSVQKVRCFKHRRSRSLHKMTDDKNGKHWRRHEAWKRERRRHRGNSKIHEHQRIIAANVWHLCNNSELAFADFGKLEQRFAAAHPEAAAWVQTCKARAAPDPSGTTAAVTACMEQRSGAVLLGIDHGLTGARIVEYKHFYDDHSPFKFRENE